MIKIENLTKQFSVGKVVFSGVDEQFEQGTFTGLIGPNGSGKTTFLRLLSVNSFPTSGTITYRGEDIHKNPHKYLHSVGLVHDEESLPTHLTAVELLEWIMRSRELWNEDADQKIDAILDQLSLNDDRYNQIGTYSTGMRKKTQIAAAMIIDPEILIMDEPMRGLDSSTRTVVMDMVLDSKQKNTTILMASHTLDRDLESIDRIIDFPLN